MVDASRRQVTEEPVIEPLRPRDAGHDHARRVWNAMVDHRTAAIGRCRQVSDVVAAMAGHDSRQRLAHGAGGLTLGGGMGWFARRHG